MHSSNLEAKAWIVAGGQAKAPPTNRALSDCSVELQDQPTTGRPSKGRASCLQEMHAKTAEGSMIVLSHIGAKLSPTLYCKPFE